MLDGPIFKAYVHMTMKNREQAPVVHSVIEAAQSAIIGALMNGEFATGPAAFDLGPRAFWFRGWPVAQWVSECQVFGLGNSERIVALEIFDPQIRESIHWFIQSADRRRFDREFEIRKSPRSATQVERETVEDPIAAGRLALGHELRRQVVVPCGRIDIYDVTANEIIECKATGSAGDLIAAVNQLRRYQAHFPGAILTVAVPAIEAEAEWLAILLLKIVHFIEVNRGGDL